MTTTAVCFGRYNPPHIGHLTVWKMASTYENFVIGTHPFTSGKKDPLTFDEKLSIVQRVDPGIANNFVHHNSWFTLVTEVGEYSDNLVLVTDEDWVVDSIKKYNGIESRHGYYDFSSISHVRSPRLASSTEIRQSVINNDIERFAKLVGFDIDIEEYFELVKSAMKRYHKIETLPHY